MDWNGAMYGLESARAETQAIRHFRNEDAIAKQIFPMYYRTATEIICDYVIVPRVVTMF